VSKNIWFAKGAGIVERYYSSDAFEKWTMSILALFLEAVKSGSISQSLELRHSAKIAK
jgi:hypothetical protein